MGCLAAILCVSLPLSASAGMVTARWGVQGRLQHAGTLRFESLGKEGALLAFDLSALPPGAQVYAARLFFFGANWSGTEEAHVDRLTFAGLDWKEKGFDIVPASKAEGKLEATGKPLAPAAPWNQWLDATEAVRSAGFSPSAPKRPEGRTTNNLLLWMRNTRAIRQEATFLEVAYEGDAPGKLPQQTSGVQAIFRSGQVFVTFREAEPLDGGEEAVNWAELVKRLRGDYYGPVPGGEQDELRYRVYSHDKPITAANVGQAQLLGEVMPGSAFNTRLGLRSDERRKTEDVVGILAGQRGEGQATGPAVAALRVAIEPGKPLPPATGVLVHTVKDEGERHYAVLTALNGVTNARDISQANVAGPIRQRPGDPEPVLYREFATPVGKANYVTQWFSYWTVQPLSPWPARYDVVVGHCPELIEKPAALRIHRGDWNSWPTPPAPHSTNAVHMSHTGDQPVDFRSGLHDSVCTIKGFDQGKWQPFHTNRQAALIKWMASRWPIDTNRIRVDMGSWGMMETKEGHLYAMIRGWGEPELTKGFQAWERALGIWGAPELYKGRPDGENPYVAANLTDWVLAHPEKELPFVFLCTGGGHPTEQGWPPFPRFCWAMMKAKQPFLYSTARSSAVAEAINKGALSIRRGQSLPAFAHCSLDDNIGEGDLLSGSGWNESQVNGWILWDPDTIVDQPARWEMTLWVGEGCLLPEGAVDLTPRRCQKFAPTPRQRFDWTNSLEDGVIQKGSAEADERGFVTIGKLRITKGRHRIAIAAAR